MPMSSAVKAKFPAKIMKIIPNTEVVRYLILFDSCQKIFAESKWQCHEIFYGK